MHKTHYPFIYIAGFFGVGIMIDHIVRSMGWGILVPKYVFLIILIFLILSWSAARYQASSKLATVFLLLTILGLGMIYTQSRQHIDANHIKSVVKYYRKKPIFIRGTVISDVQVRQAINGVKTTFTLKVDEVQAPWGWEKKSGKILVNIFRKRDIQYGNYISLEGKIHRPYNFSNEKNFSYKDYLLHRNIHFILSVKKDGILHIIEQEKGRYLKQQSLMIRDKLRNILNKNLTHNESGIMRAILLGDRSGMVKPVRELFVQTGTAHILAISGLHMGVVAGLFLIVVRLLPIGRRGQLTIVIGLLGGYAFLTGGRPSVVRATIMMIVLLASFIIEKEPNILNTLFLAAMVILVYNPLNLFDVGFQLSFVCVLSIVMPNLIIRKQKHGQKIEHIISAAEPVYRFFGDSLKVSLSIWVGVAGFIAYYFGMITPITIFANLLVIPLVSAVVTLGFGLLIVGFIYPSWAFMFAACLKIVLNGMIGIIFLCSKIPFAYFYVRDVRIWHVGVYYFVLFIVVFLSYICYSRKSLSFPRKRESRKTK